MYNLVALGQRNEGWKDRWDGGWDTYMATDNLDFNLNPTQAAYVFSTSVVNAIISNTGEGKSFASVLAMVVHAQRCNKDIRVAIVRDTHENIKNSTVRTIQEVFESRPDLIRFLDTNGLGSMKIEDRVNLQGDTILVMGYRNKSDTFPYGFFKWWKLDPNIGKFETIR